MTQIKIIATVHFIVYILLTVGQLGTSYKLSFNVVRMYVYTVSLYFFLSFIPLFTCKYPCCRKVLEVHGENILTMI
jgi:hypothetical protein